MSKPTSYSSYINSFKLEDERTLERLEKDIEKIKAGNYSKKPNLLTAEDLDAELENQIEVLQTSYGNFYTKNNNLIAARPGHGKTSLGIALANEFEMQGKKCVYISWEQGAVDLGIRYARYYYNRSRQVAYPINIFRSLIKNKNSKEYKFTRNLFQDRLKDYILFFGVRYDTKMLKILFLKLFELMPDIKVVFFDYIQKIRGADKYKSRYEQLLEISEDLLSMAKDFGTANIIFTQFGRATGKNNCLRLDNIKGCGEIEQDAATAYGLWNSRQAIAQGDSSEEDVERCQGVSPHISPVIYKCMKNRDGDTFSGDMNFCGSSGVFKVLLTNYDGGQNGE